MFKQEKGIWVADVGEVETYQLTNESYSVWATMSGTYMGLSITALWSIALGSLWQVSEHWAWVWKESFGGWEPHVLSPDCGVVLLLLVFRTWMTWLCYFLICELLWGTHFAPHWATCSVLSLSSHGSMWHTVEQLCLGFLRYMDKARENLNTQQGRASKRLILICPVFSLPVTGGKSVRHSWGLLRMAVLQQASLQNFYQ